jgi:NAD(P)H dehydrogenase (quinone)
VKIFIVFAHPEPLSFNGAMFRTASAALRAAGHEVKTSDLYAMHFNPVSGRHNFTSVKDPAYYKQQMEEQYATEQGALAPDIETEIQKLEWCDLMIWQFPLWWFSLPGILKGWVDRVLAMGRTYGGGRMYDKGVFRGKRALLSLTTGGPAASYAKDGFQGDINAMLRPIHRGILQFVGFEVLAPQVTYGPVRLEPAQVQAQLDAWAERLRKIEQEQPVEVGRY